MTSWINPAFQRVSSLNIGPVSLGRRMSVLPQPQDVVTFKDMVSNLKKEDSPAECISYFIKHLGDKSESQLSDYNISSEISRLIRHTSQFLNHFFKKQDRTERVFRFLLSALQVYQSSQRTDTAILRIIIKTAQTDDINKIESAVSFVQASFSKPDLLNYFFSGNQIISIWDNIYITEKETARMYFSTIINAAASAYVVKDFESIKDFTERVQADIENYKIDQNNASASLLFMGYIIKTINSGDFVINIMEFISEIAPNLDDISFFELLLVAPCNDPGAAWSALDAICYNNIQNIELLKQALTAIYNCGKQPDNAFMFNSYVSVVCQFDDYYQKMLFDVLEKSNLITKVDFLSNVMPLQETAVPTEALLRLVNCDFGEYLDDLIKNLLIEPDYNDVNFCITKDEFFFEITSKLLNQLSPNSPNTEPLFTLFSKIIDEGEDIAIPLLETLMIKSDPMIYIQNLIETLKSGPNSDSLMEAFANVAEKKLGFSELFLFQMNGIELIDFIVETKAGLDFLACLLIDGPYKEVDDYIFEHFSNTSLANYDEKALIDLMFGVRQGSTIPGFIRIPSLCAFVKDVPLKTPYDQYIYGSIAVNNYKDEAQRTNIDEIMKFAPRYLTYDQAKIVCNDPELLPTVTDPLFPHSIFYQFHPGARNCFIDFERSNSFSFWFMVNSIFSQGRTTIAIFPGGSIELEANGYITYANRSIYCSLKEWHLFTLVTNERSNNAQQKVVSGYFDNEKMGDIQTTGKAIITIGANPNNPQGNYLCNALWFLSPFIHTKEFPIEKDDIAKILDKGPNFSSQKTIAESNGVRLVQYHGILRFIHLFGGPYYLFNLMLSAQTKEHFMFYIQSAFNFYKMKIFRKRTFFSSIHYIMRRKMELFTPQVEQIILHELESNGEFDWKSLRHMLADMVLLSSPYVSCHFLLKVFQMHKICKQAIPFFHHLVDTYVFFNNIYFDGSDSSNKVNSVPASAIFDVFQMFLQFRPSLIKKLMMACISISHSDTDDVEIDLTDEKNFEKQKYLLHFIIKDSNLFVSQIKCDAAFLFAIKLDNRLCLDVLKFIAGICVSNPDYFDNGQFLKISSHLFYIVKYEKLWIILFMFLTNQKAESFEEFLMFGLYRENLIPIIFDLITYLTSFEITNNTTESISFRAIHTIYSLIMSQSHPLSDYIGSIQNLCSLGFGERNPCPYPFNLSKRQLFEGKTVPRRSNRGFFGLSIDMSSGIAGESKASGSNSFGSQTLIDMDDKVKTFESMQRYMKRHPVSQDQFADLDIETSKVPANIQDISESNTANIISIIASKTILESAKDISTFKKHLEQLTIYGADVVSSVAIFMHKKVIFALFDEHLRMENDALIAIIEFVVHRIVEGWWNGSILPLFKKVINVYSDSSHNLPTNKILLNFIIASLSKIDSNNTEEVRNVARIFIGIKISKPQLLSYCMSNQIFVNSFIALLTTNKMLSDSENIELYKELTELPSLSSDKQFTEFVYQNDIESYLKINTSINTNYLDNTKSIESSASNNSNQVKQARQDRTRKNRVSRVLRFERSNISHVTYLRRAFRFELFLRLNKELAYVERSITLMFRAKNNIIKSQEIPARYSLSMCTHPLSVPIKLIPLLYPYDSKYEKVSTLPTIPAAEFQNQGIEDITYIKEFTEVHYGPRCLQGWFLPGHYKAGVADVFKQMFSSRKHSYLYLTSSSDSAYSLGPSLTSKVTPSSTSQSSPNLSANSNSSIGSPLSNSQSGALSEENDIFSMTMISAPEPLKCVGLITANEFVVLLNATTSQHNEEIDLLNECGQICHYPIYEEAMQGIYGPSTLFIGHIVLLIPYSLVTIARPRTYIYKDTAIDIFTAYGCHLSFDVRHKSIRKLLFSKMANLQFATSIRRGPGFSLRLLGKSIDHISKYWASNLLSNFDYLLYLNSMAGRSFKDLSQYPVFPWVIGDYSNKINSPDGKSLFQLRDLTKPMGQLNEDRAQRYDLIFNETDPHYFYGTHYSFPVAVLYFLMRVEPHTLYNVFMHSGFDQPDRVFLSIEDAWKSASELNQADVKELIPEFYCLPSLFINENKYNFPKTSNGTEIDTVSLPQSWKCNPRKFVHLMREALESHEVTELLPQWIDLIFGYKQRGEAAIEAKNLFHPLSYDDVTLTKENEEADRAFIANFGQCPAQLFTAPHIMRSQKDFITIANSDQIKITELRQLSVNSKKSSKKQKIDSIYVIDEDLKVLPKFSHFVGFIGKVLKISDGILNVDGMCQYTEPAFDISSSSSSSDLSIITIATKVGMLLNYYYQFGFTLISSSVVDEVSFISCASSLHFGMSCGSSINSENKCELFLFDLASGFLMRKAQVDSEIKFIKFEEVHDYLICSSSTKCYVFDLELTEVCSYKASESDDNEITSLTLNDSVIWFPRPFFVTGHSNGNINAWEINLYSDDSPHSKDAYLKKIILAEDIFKNKTNKSVVAMNVFSAGKGLVCTNEDGDACLLSVAYSYISRGFLKASCFNECPSCHSTLIQSQAIMCSVCGLPYCRSCITNSKDPICRSCEMAGKHSTKTRVSSSLSSFRSEDTISTIETPDQPSSLDFLIK